MKEKQSRSATLAGALGFALPVLLTTGDVHAKQPRDTRPENNVRKPNIVVILNDNLGYGDVGVYGGGIIRGAPTPRIDQLASEGLRLTNFNVEPECTPSRTSLMTGRMPVRCGTSEVAAPGLPSGLAPWEYTMAELLSDAGYDTAIFGKWHLGNRQGRFPTDQGFDEWWGFPNSSNASLTGIQPGFDPKVASLEPIMEGRKGRPVQKVGDYTLEMRPKMDEIIAGKAVDYIKAHAREGKPFFLYVPFSLPHFPPLPNPKLKDKDKTDYQNVVMEIDQRVGQVLDALKQTGIDKDTIVVWTSDNGPESGQGIGVPRGPQGDPGPFRGEFPSAWEGAIRVPCIIRWPGQVRAGSTSNEIVSILDFYRTFADIIGRSDLVPADRPIDSMDQADFFLGRQEKSNREFVLFFHSNELLAIKWRRFKVHLAERVPAQGAVRDPGQGVYTGIKEQYNYPLIFNIDDDPKELWNIATANDWLGEPISKILMEYGRSAAAFPNLKTGADGPQPAKGQPGGK